MDGRKDSTARNDWVEYFSIASSTMVKAVVISLLLVGVLGFSRCEEDRTIRIQIDGNEVSRNTYYANKKPVKLACVAKDVTALAIFRGKDIDQKKDTAVCTITSQGKCAFGNNEVALNISEDANYTCMYTQDAKDTAVVTVYFGNGKPLKVYGDNNAEVMDTSSLQVKSHNDTAYRFVCPGPDAGQTDTKVHWYRNEHLMKFEHNPHYELNDTNYDLTFKAKTAKSLDSSRYGGWYRCERVTEEGNFLQRAFIKVNSDAYANAAQKSYNKMEGEEVTMSCDVEGEPVPAVSWIRKDKPLTADDKRIKYYSFKGIANASMTISNLVADDYGDYACVADHGDTHAEAVILLRVRSKLAALWPFLGIVAEVIVLVVIIFIYEKRRAKKEQEETEDTADQKKSLTASNNENKDVRQRKA